MSRVDDQKNLPLSASTPQGDCVKGAASYCLQVPAAQVDQSGDGKAKGTRNVIVCHAFNASVEAIRCPRCREPGVE